ncbi:MAG: SDR family oxidoreductase [Actinomycetota bacterium]
MELGLKGRAAVVTASSKGLGRACALALASEGCDIAISARGEEALRKTEAELQALGARVRAVVADVSKPEDCKRIVDGAADEFGRLDVLVPIAGGPPPGPFDSFDDEAYRKALELDLMSVVRLCAAAVPIMRQRSWGRVVTVQSISIKQPLPGLVLSNTSRAGVAGFAKTLANELASEGITVNTVCPGPTLTDRIKNLASAAASQGSMTFEDAIRAYESDIPMRRLGKPEEIGALVAYLASEPAAFLTGLVVQADGGMYRGLL